MTELERQLDNFGARLARAAAQAPPPHRRRLALSVATGAVLIAVVAVVLAASGERRLDPVAEARAALAPPGEIVYMKVTSTTSARGASGVPPPRTTEQWWTADPLSWRLEEVIPRPTRRSGGRWDADGPIFGREERSYAAGVTRHYLAERDTLVVVRGYRDDEGAAQLPSALGAGSGDPEADLRSMLLEGTVTDRGERRLRGRTVRRFVVEQRSRRAVDPTAVRQFVYDVDPETFAPIEARFSASIGKSRSPTRITVRMRVDAYRRIPLTAQSAELLRITTTPNTKATFDTAQRLRARARAWRAKCRTLKSGALACPPPFPPPKVPKLR